MFQIIDEGFEADRLTQSIIQIRDFLGLYNAELARILGVHCDDVAQLGARHLLDPSSQSWQQALLLRTSYQLLYDRCNGDGAAMNHWLRRSHSILKPSPLMAMVDHQGLVQVHNYLSEYIDQ